MTKSEAQTILDCYEQLESNKLPIDLIDEAYSLIPGVTEQTFQRVKIQQIRRFVTFNQDVLYEALNEVTPEEIEDSTYDQMNSDDIIQQIENETYGDYTPEDQEIGGKTKVITRENKGKVGRPKTRIEVKQRKK